MGDDLLSISVNHERKSRPDWQSLLQNISVDSKDLSNFDLFVFGQGPGSYTSIRSVATFLKAISLMQSKPLMPISNLECIAFEHTIFNKEDQSIHCAILSDIKSEAYYAEFNFIDGSLKNVGSEMLVNKTDLQKTASENTNAVFLGNAWDSVDEVNVNLDIKSNAASLIELALSKYSEDSKYRPEDANPVYIKETTYKKLNDQ
jgi:tRNA threonylcarbamoyladenosine biosynthesis protein TsaB